MFNYFYLHGTENYFYLNGTYPWTLIWEKERTFCFLRNTYLHVIESKVWLLYRFLVFSFVECNVISSNLSGWWCIHKMNQSTRNRSVCMICLHFIFFYWFLISPFHHFTWHETNIFLSDSFAISFYWSFKALVPRTLYLISPYWSLLYNSKKK